MINVANLRKTLEHITAHPEEWVQEEWGIQRSCGTAYCVAGTAIAHLTTHRIHWVPMRVDGAQVSRLGDVTVNGIVIGVVAAARDVLGLDARQAEVLFNASNTLGDLWHFAHRWTRGEIEIPAGMTSRFNATSEVHL